MCQIDRRTWKGRGARILFQKNDGEGGRDGRTSERARPSRGWGRREEPRESPGGATGRARRSPLGVSIRAADSRTAGHTHLVEGADVLRAGVRLEILEHHLFYDEALLGSGIVRPGRGRRRGGHGASGATRRVTRRCAVEDGVALESQRRRCLMRRRSVATGGELPGGTTLAGER